ncbi:sensory neuron membrane protein 1-like [Culicoides brevitarsis]|uniref:sensory neuron membrane protein 1-like n=1 Tax=Culicoides brevitarsis TaxID=469753 RepID=UPI00307B9D13
MPNVEEIGPYVYEVSKYRKNEVDDEDSDTLTYDLVNLFHYRPDLSAPSDVTICQLSPLLIGGLVKVIIEMPELINFVQAGLALVHGRSDTPFICFNALEPIHIGYYINCNQTEFTAKAICSALGAQDFFRKINGSDKHLEFAQLFKFNNTVEATLTILRGTKVPQDIGKVVAVNGKASLDIFENEKCNVINGTDGISFPPKQMKDKEQWMYYQNIFKSLPLEFTRKKSIHGINTLLKEIKWDSHLFDPDCNINEYLDYQIKGVIDMHEYLEGFTWISGPHNYLAEEKMSENIQGFHPNKQKHFSGVYLDPLTGVMLRNFIRFQINVLSLPIETYPILSQVRESRVPYYWLDFSYEASPAILHRLQIIHTVKSVANFIGRSAFIIGIVGCIVSIAGIAFGIGPDTPKILNVIPNEDASNKNYGSASTQAEN